MLRYYGLSLLSGCLWGALGFALSREVWPHLIWASVAASPLIGLGAGWLFQRVGPTSLVARIIFSFVTLYVAVGLFGLAAGVYDAFRVPPQPFGAHRILWAVVVQAVLAAWWGVTFSGIVAVLWPLSYFNHSLVCWFSSDRGTRPPSQAS